MKKPTSPPALRDQCLSHFKILGVPIAPNDLDAALEQADKETQSHLKFLDLLLGQQATARRDRAVERRIREGDFEERKIMLVLQAVFLWAGLIVVEKVNGIKVILVVTARSSVRRTPRRNSKFVGTLLLGQTVELIEDCDGKCKIEYFDFDAKTMKEGWVVRQHLESAVGAVRQLDP